LWMILNNPIRHQSFLNQKPILKFQSKEKESL